MLKKIFLTLFFLGFLCLAALGGFLYYNIAVEPGTEIRVDNIQKILAKESNVFYSDGKTRLGVLFDEAHRQYVEYKDIPKNFVNSLVASEDNKFFSHFGFDILGITRAMIKNIQAGRVVQGGSTLTQQTAKNLFKRSGRSYQAKLKELLFALKLEYHYSKEKIFEFYANQFYVSGNGHGLGVAARFYFDKKVEDLTLLECAFIAGSVKRPNYYNPLIKKTEASKELALSRARVRVKYVLDKMLELQMIDRFTYSETLNQQLVFNKGKVGFDLDYGMELVREAVSSSEVLKALELNDIPNIATSGARIVTTLDKELQDRSLSILRGELSRLDVRLRGYERDEVQAELKELDYKGDNVAEEGRFVFGAVRSVEGQKDKLRISVELDGRAGRGVIDSKGIEKIVWARTKFLQNTWSEPGKADTLKLLEQIQTGDRVWVKILHLMEDGSWALELEKFPKVQGGAIVLQDSFIRAMAGGVENQFFNRAVQARRTMGSSFKPLVYTAALQLGWNPVDSLRNARDVFVYHGQPYFPRPDHNSPYEWVSMSWAGVHSENVASVWLLSRLCDQLTPLQFREVAEHVGLAPKIVDGEEEPYRTYKTRIRDRYGILVNQQSLRSTAFRMAVKNLETDFIFDGMEREYQTVQKLHYGLDYDSFYGEVEEELRRERHNLREYEAKELESRKTILKRTFLRLEQLENSLAAYRAYIEGHLPFSAGRPVGRHDTAGLYSNAGRSEFSFLEAVPVTPGWQLFDEFELLQYLKTIDVRARELFWTQVKLNGEVTVAAFRKVLAQTEHEYEQLLEELPYSFEVLSQVEDFRITVGLYYLIELAKQLGVSSDLEPVLSFPLGSNVITLYEATRMYEGIVTGKVNVFGDPENGDSNESLAIIDHIESADGEVLYKPEVRTRVPVDEKTRLAVGSILENIVKFGTGRSADKQIRLKGTDSDSGAVVDGLDLAVPVLGKTGTANKYTNAAFLGYLPGVNEKGSALEIRDGFAIGVYAGFDDNEPMQKRTTRISGAQGALPAWIEIVNTLLQEQKYAGKLDEVDLTFNGLGIMWGSLGQKNMSVNPDAGGLLVSPATTVSSGSRYLPSILSFGSISESGRFIEERNYSPFWRAGKQ